MPSFTSDPKKPGGKKDRSYAQIALLGAVPGILIGAPLVGLFVGMWADGKFGTSPYLTIGCLILGFVAAGREVYKLVKKSEELENEKDEKWYGP